jgi:hypothetical protein
MQSVRTDSIKTKNPKRSIALSAAALFAGLAAFAFTACDSTDSPPASTGLITLTSPKGGETFKVGETVHIKWTVKVDDKAPNAVDPQVSLDTGKTWLNLRQSIPDNSAMWGDFPWLVDSVKHTSLQKIPLAGKKVLLRVEQYSTSLPEQRSTLTKLISITAP